MHNYFLSHVEFSYLFFVLLVFRYYQHYGKYRFFSKILILCTSSGNLIISDIFLLALFLLQSVFFIETKDFLGSHLKQNLLNFETVKLLHDKQRFLL